MGGGSVDIQGRRRLGALLLTSAVVVTGAVACGDPSSVTPAADAPAAALPALAAIPESAVITSQEATNPCGDARDDGWGERVVELRPHGGDIESFRGEYRRALSARGWDEVDSSEYGPDIDLYRPRTGPHSLQARLVPSPDGRMVTVVIEYSADEEC